MIYVAEWAAPYWFLFQLFSAAVKSSKTHYLNKLELLFSKGVKLNFSYLGFSLNS